MKLRIKIRETEDYVEKFQYMKEIEELLLADKIEAEHALARVKKSIDKLRGVLSEL